MDELGLAHSLSVGHRRHESFGNIVSSLTERRRGETALQVLLYVTSTTGYRAKTPVKCCGPAEEIRVYISVWGPICQK